MNWVQINAKYQASHPNVLNVIDLALSLPASSAECERGFSAMKLIKTDRRNRLKGTTLTDVMRVKLLSPDISDFDPTTAIHLWNTTGSRSRRPLYKGTKAGFLKESAADSSSNDATVADTAEGGSDNLVGAAAVNHENTVDEHKAGESSSDIDSVISDDEDLSFSDGVSSDYDME